MERVSYREWITRDGKELHLRLHCSMVFVRKMSFFSSSNRGKCWTLRYSQFTNPQLWPDTFKYVPVASTALAKQNSKQVSIKGSDDKRSITATFTITMDGKFLGLQLIYGRKTNQSLTRYQFPKDFSLSVNPKHYSNEKESLKLIDKIVLSYVTKGRQRLVKPNQKALVIFDVFKVQITDKVLSRYKDRGSLCSH